MLQKSLFVLLLGLLLTSCLSADELAQQSKKDRLEFEKIMNRSVGHDTYEHIIGFFGPPTERTETASTITAVWEDPTSNGFRNDRVDTATGGLSRSHGERVRMVFDRRTQLMKSWDYPDK
jgi:hypothetical protein